MRDGHDSGDPGPAKPGTPYPKAELLQRILARLLDLIVCGIFCAIPRPASGPLVVLGPLAGAIYLLLADGMFRGQSPGKRLLGIRVIKLSNRQGAGYRESALRNLPVALIGLLAIALPSWKWIAAGSIAILGTEAYRTFTDVHGIRLGDAVAGTQVIDGKVLTPAAEMAAGVGNRARVNGSAPAARMRRRAGRREIWIRSRQS
jgi:uncharacterized RDD family membrane protein YckC